MRWTSCADVWELWSTVQQLLMTSLLYHININDMIHVTCLPQPAAFMEENTA